MTGDEKARILSSQVAIPWWRPFWQLVGAVGRFPRNTVAANGGAKVEEG